MILWSHNNFLRQHALPSMNSLLYTANYYNFCISQGNVATVLRWGGQNCSHLPHVTFLHDVTYGKRCQKITKVGQCFTELFKK